MRRFSVLILEPLFLRHDRETGPSVDILICRTAVREPGLQCFLREIIRRIPCDISVVQ